MQIQNYAAGRGAIWLRDASVCVSQACCCGGKMEKRGPFGSCLDLYVDPDDLSCETYEKAESEMVRRTVNLLLKKAGITAKNVDLMLGGDLMNQCTATAYGLTSFGIPYMGLYGACSTFVEGMLAASMLIEGGSISSAVVVASSHFCTAERQFRFPLSYGAMPSGTAQNTVTGCGAVLLTKADANSEVTVGGGIFGIPVDSGVRDGGNMGAAMAPAAEDTLLRYFGSTGESFGDFDRIATGDLGKEGLSILSERLEKRGCVTEGRLSDCGVMIYDVDTQDVGRGGSGCGCSAVMTAGVFFDELKRKQKRRIGIAGTGALMSPGSLLQGETIPSVCHMIVLES